MDPSKLLKPTRLSGSLLQVAAHLMEFPITSKPLARVAAAQLGLDKLTAFRIPDEAVPFCPVHFGRRGRHE